VEVFSGLSILRKQMGKKTPLEENCGHWTGLNAEPENYFGFIYLITNLKNGKMYVGKKQFWVTNRRKYKKTSKVTDHQSDKWRSDLWEESDWKTYTGSSKKLNEDIHKYGKENFRFEIIKLCRSKGDLHYSEVEEQVLRDVLRATDQEGNYKYYNGHIAAVKFRPPSHDSYETRKKKSESNKGKEGWNTGIPWSEETKEKMRESAIRNGNKPKSFPDKTEYHMINIETGEEFQGTRQEWELVTDASGGSIFSQLLKGHMETAYGWFIKGVIGNVDEEYYRRYVRGDVTVIGDFRTATD